MTVISKSSFIRGLQCPKSLYLHFNAPELGDEITPVQQMLFDTGHHVGEAAHLRWPGGKDASRGSYSEVEEAIAYTQKLIESGQKVIYEAAFATQDSLCFIDILVRNEYGWEAYEVKASTTIKDYHLWDAAYQYFTITGAGLPLREISVVHLNNQYVRHGEIDPSELFTIVPLKEEILTMQDEIRELLEEIQKTLNSDSEPDIAIGPHCGYPFDCNFNGHCWRDVPEASVFSLSRIGKKAFSLYEQGILEMKDIPEDFRLTPLQRIQVESVIMGKVHREPAKIKNFLSGMEYPLYFLDFETINPAIPLFEGTRPYQQLPFQYSLHIKNTPTAGVRHLEFLADAGSMTDPRPALIERMIADLGTHGTILAYNKGFESGRIAEMAEVFPQYREALLSLIDRLSDLMVPFQQGWYYSPVMNGSYSIKAVLPALVPDLTYADLEVREGGTASLYFISLLFEKDPERIRSMRKALLEYCKMDTLAMVRILEVLYNELGIRN